MSVLSKATGSCNGGNCVRGQSVNNDIVIKSVVIGLGANYCNSNINKKINKIK